MLLYTCGTYMKHLSALFLFILMGCGKPVYHVNPLLEPYIQMFREYSLYFGKPQPVSDLSADFGVLDVGILGVCDFNTNTITISEIYWKHAPEEAKEVVIFHELGHCILHRGHTTAMINKSPASIMYPYDITKYFPLASYYYMFELFNGN